MLHRIPCALGRQVRVQERVCSRFSRWKEDSTRRLGGSAPGECCSEKVMCRSAVSRIAVPALSCVRHGQGTRNVPLVKSSTDLSSRQAESLAYGSTGRFWTGLGLNYSLAERQELGYSLKRRDASQGLH
jgi:hypothetical protein